MSFKIFILNFFRKHGFRPIVFASRTVAQDIAAVRGARPRKGRDKARIISL